MKKKTILLTGLVAVSIALAGCGEKQEVQKAEPATTTEVSQANTQDKEQPTTPKKSGPWTYIEGFHWEDNYKGLKTEINRAVISNELEITDQQGQLKKVSGIGFNFVLHNTTEGKFTTYPDQAVLVTSTGEQIETPYRRATKSIGGEIDKGVTKEGNVTYILERGNADKIKWIKLTWWAHQGPETKLDSPTKEYEIELKIPQ
ncbi:hypothetical protein [Aneurinibacillus aneurinilyticus]|uniref:hypothetical protein n=1 Tax=Aneurinibacillus aneurinilyticus TaxID=1391 RepID=UPI0023F0F6B6|nr:hypothetical protein [Aneurinibacillus aneurinilyticus]